MGVFLKPKREKMNWQRMSIADRFILFWMDENQENIKQRLEYVIRKIEEIPERLEIPNLFPVFGIFHTIVLDEIDPLYGNAVQAKHQIKGRRDRHYIFYDRAEP